MLYYSKDAPPLACTAPSTKLTVLGALLSVLGALLTVPYAVLDPVPELAILRAATLHAACVIFFVAMFAFVGALAAHYALTDAKRARIMVRKALFLPENGNPLCLKEGERLPKVSCIQTGPESFSLVLGTGSCTAEVLAGVSSSISSGLRGRLEGYAVTQTDTDVARNRVTFTIENVTRDRSLVVNGVSELLSGSPTLLRVQDGTLIDLTTSGSILCAGVTRSGKTSGVLALLLQVLAMGPDDHGSKVTIIDPKQAELSRIPGSVTVDPDGEGHAILASLRDFADTVTARQRYLNKLSDEVGDAVKWWDAGMHVSMVFIDEYVAARTLFPSRASKDDPGYSLAAFDGLIKRIVTMGASAGCYAIVSIAEASVESGGLPAMLRSAMSTKVLFRPSMPEARLMWDAEKLKDMPERVYSAGDAWFSTTDGIHDRVSYVHFPVMNFPAYAELARLMKAYCQ